MGRDVSSDDEEKETAVGTEEKSHGLVTIQGGSIQDYFAKKMAELKARGKATYTPSADEPESDSAEDTVPDKDESCVVAEEEVTEGTKKKKCKKAKTEETLVEPSEDSCDVLKKKKKKKTKETLVEPSQEAICDGAKKNKKTDETPIEPSGDTSDGQKKKKKKKTKETLVE